MPDVQQLTRPLFREEALRAGASSLEGDVLLAQPWATKLMAPVLGAISFVGLLFLACAEYPRTERVSGYLAPDVGVSEIVPPRAGTVAEVHVQVGDRVEPGDVLITIRSGLA